MTSESKTAPDGHAAPLAATIRGNTVRRLVRLDRVLPPGWGDGGEGIFFGRNPITLFCYDDATVENNEFVGNTDAGCIEPLQGDTDENHAPA